MDKTSLESFISVAELRSFSKAAEKLHITQPAISKRIASLEQQLGSKLFIRDSKQIELSYSGQVFLPHAHAILQAMRDSQIAVQNTKTQIAGNLAVGISHHIGLHRMPSILKTFTDNFPDVHLQLRFITSEEAASLIQSDELEIAIITLPEKAPDKIQATILWQDPLQIVVAGNHELTEQLIDHRISIEDLSRYPAILPSFDSYTGQLIQPLFQHTPIIRHIETNNLETIRIMTTIGLGWAVLPRSMLNSQLQGLGLAGDLRLPSRKLGIMQRESRIISSPAQAFIQTLKHSHAAK